MKKLKNKALSVLAILAMAGVGLVGCGDDPVTPPAGKTPLEEAAYYIDQIYQSDEGKTKTADFDRISSYTDDQNRVFTIDWSVTIVTDGAPATSVKVVAGKDKSGKDDANLSMIDIDEESEMDVDFKLSGVMHYGEESVNLTTLNLKMPKLHIADWDEYVAACKVSGSSKGDSKNTTMSVEGIVTAIIGTANGNTSQALYAQDVTGKGAYYAYGLPADPAESVQIGQKVRITGETGLYSGTYEILGPSISKIYDDAPAKVDPVDYTTKFTSATALTDPALTDAQGLYVSLKDVVIDDEDLSNGYFNFKLGNLKSYVRISSSVCPISKDAQAKMKADHLAKRGWVADVKGIISLFSGAFYLSPIDAEPFTFKSLPQLTDDEAVAFEKDILTTSVEITKNGDVTLPTTGASYDKVGISWASNNAAAVVSADGKKVTYTIPNATTEIKLTATLKCNSVTDTKEFTVKLIADKSSIAEAIKAGLAVSANGVKTEDLYLIVGTISKIDTEYNEQYKNVSFYVSDGTMEVLVYRYNLDDASTVKVGDFVALAAPMTKYNTKAEAVADFVKLTNYKSIADVLPMCVSDNKTEATVYGFVKSIDTAYSEQYDNITITLSDGTNDVSCYRLKGGADLAIGDWITVNGTPSAYNTSKQFAQNATYDKSVIYVAPPVVVEPVNLVVADATYVPKETEAVTDKFKGTATWTVEAGKLPAGKYDIFLNAKITTKSSDHSNATLFDGDKPFYTISINGAPVLPTDKTSKRTDLGWNLTDFADGLYLAGFEASADITSVEVKFTGSGYSMYIGGVRIAPAEERFTPEHAGTEADPYSIADALGMAATMGKTTATKDPGTQVNVNTYVDTVEGYFKGVITTEGSYNTKKYQSNFKLSDSGSTEALLVYSANLNNDDRIYLNDEVVVKGTLMNYNGTIEISSVNTYKDGTNDKGTGKIVDTTIYAEVISISKGTSNITATPFEGGAVTDLSATSGKNGSTFTFKVNVTAEGKTIDAVKVNGEVITADANGVYTGTIKGNTSISVSLKEAGAEYLSKTYDLLTIANSLKATVSSGTKVAKLTADDDFITIAAKVTGSNSSKLYYSDTVATWRFYQSENGSFVISCANGYVIAKVVVVWSPSESGATLSTGGAVYESGTDCAVNSSSIEFVATGKKNAQIKSITVYYSVVE